MQPESFDSRDLGEIEAFASKIYSKLRIGAVGEDTRARISRRVLAPEVGFDELDYSFDIGYAGEPPGLLIVCDVVSSTIRRVGEGHEDTFGPGEQFLIGRPDLPYAGVAHSSRLRFTVLDPAVLNRVAADGDMPVPVRILDHRPVSRQAQLRLQRTIDYVRGDMMAWRGGPAAPLVVSAAGQLLAASVLETYPNTAVSDPTAADRRDGHPATMRRAMAFIDEHAHEDITIADIAAAAFVTTRAVQLAFRRHLDMTPLEYLRRVRLARAHHDLRNADPASSTVTAIAYRWGFSDPSRFAARYREAYGIHPSQTLHDG